MNGDIDEMKYYMAAEKIGNLLFTVDQVMEFMEEYKIVPDEEVKKALMPMINRMKEWMKDEK